MEKNKANAAPGIDDEEIIDLTDIIEKGTVRASKAKEGLDTQMSDLGNAGGTPASVSEVDADIDALLAQMDSGMALGAPAAATPAAPASSGSQADDEFNLDETLDMPGMAEVDSLLQDLDMPPQPTAQAAATPTPPADNVPDGGDLDALLDGMLEGPSAAPSASGSASAPATAAFPDDDDIFGSVNSAPPGTAGAKDEKVGDGMDDLDALLSGLDGLSSAAPTASAAPIAAKSTPVPPTPAATATAPGASSLEDDLEALLGGLGAPAMPAAASAPAALAEPPAPKASTPPQTDDLGLDDLDALLGGGSVATPAPQAAPVAPAAPAAPPAPKAPTPPQTDDLGLDDLDALLGLADTASPVAASTPPAAPAAPAAPPAPKAPTPPQTDDLGLDDLDALLGLADTASPVAASTPPAAPASTAPSVADSPSTSFDVNDLNDLFREQAHKVDVQSANPVPDVSELDLESLLGNAAAESPEDTQPEPDADTLDMLKNFDDTAMPSTGESRPVSSLEEDLMNLDAILGKDSAGQDSSPTLKEEGLSPPKPQPVPEVPLSLTDDSELLADIDALLGSGPQPEEAPEVANVPTEGENADTWRAPLSVSSEDEGLSLADAVAPPTPAELQRAAQELLDEKVMVEASIDNVDTKAWLDSLDDVLQATPEKDVPADTDREDSMVGGAVAAGAFAAGAGFSDEDRSRMEALETKLTTLEEQGESADLFLRQLGEQVNTQNLRHAERLSAVEARLASVQAEAQAETVARLEVLEGRMEKQAILVAESGEALRVLQESSVASADLLSDKALEDALPTEEQPSEDDAPGSRWDEDFAQLTSRVENLQEQLEAQGVLAAKALRMAEDVHAAEATRAEQAEEAAASTVTMSTANNVDITGVRLDLLEGRIMVLEDAEERRERAHAEAAEGVAAFVDDEMAQEASASALWEAPLQALEERIAVLEKQAIQGQVDMEGRLTALEARFQQMEADMLARIENAAAAAAARVIREEITALMASE